MANASAKKRQIKSQSLRANHMKALLAINTLYFLLRVVWCWSSFTIWHLAAVGMFIGIAFFALNMMLSIAEEGNNYSIYQDILYVNWIVQLATILTEWGFLLYLSIPGYVLYMHGGFLWGLFRGVLGLGGGGGGGSGGEAPDSDEPSAQELRRAKRAERRRVKTFRA